MRVAQSRCDVLQSADRAGNGAGGCLEAMHLTRRTLKLAGLAAVALVGFRLVSAVLPARASRVSRFHIEPSAVPRPGNGVPGSLFKYLVAQISTVVLLPLLRDRLLASRLSERFDYWRPSRIFFRWVGLER